MLGFLNFITCTLCFRNTSSFLVNSENQVSHLEGEMLAVKQSTVVCELVIVLE